jgi:acetolactate synthase-1/2/3 large subunit
MLVYEAIVKGLESLGVKAAFGGAGENDASLLLSLKHSTKIKPIIVRNEQAASFMACGYAMFSDQLGVCFATAGPGAFNLFSGLAVAMSDSYPILAISGFASLAWIGKGALNETSGLHRTPDSRAMFAATTKRSYLLDDPANTIDILEEAVNIAFEGRPGPVHIHVAENITHPSSSVQNYRDPRLERVAVKPDPVQVKAASDALGEALAAHKPILALIGFGAVQSNAGAELQALVERFQIPFVTTLDGKGIIPEAHPLAAGVFADSGHPTARQAYHDAEVILAVGNSFAQHATFNFNSQLPADKTLIHVNIDPTEIGKVYDTAFPLAADARLGIAALLEALTASGAAAQDAHITHKDYATEPIMHLLSGVHPGQLAQSVSRMLPPNGIVLTDAGAHLAWFAYYLELKEGQHHRKPGSFGPMACNVNGALGVKCAHPDRTVVVGCGDGGYLLSGFELLTAVQYDLPVIWIVFNDGEFKLIKLYQLETYGESGLVEFTNPDYVVYAKACGADGYKAESLAQFEAAFEAALASRRPTLIDAVIDRDALPHYSSSPAGELAGILDAIETKLGL